MEIRLIRHGKPQFWTRYEPYSLISGARWGAAIVDYNNSGVMPSSRPPRSSLEAARSAAAAFCSGLRRTVETANALGVRCELIENPLFIEPEIPHGFWKRIRLPLALWFMVSQTLWHLGFSPNCEPVKRAKARAEKAAALLIRAAKQNGTALLIGHSLMNNMIFRALRRRGWEAVGERYDGRFWGCNVLRLER